MGQSPHRWVNTGRLIKHYAPFPDPLPDPHGIVANWLDTVRIENVSAEETVCDPWFKETRPTNECSWGWVKRGHGKLFLHECNHTYSTHPGAFSFSRPGMHATLCYPGPIRAQGIGIHFTATVHGWMDIMTLLGFPFYLPGPDSRLAGIFQRLVREQALKAPGWRQAMAADVMSGILHIVRQYGSKFEPSEWLARQQDIDRVLPALALIERELGNPALTVRDLARSISLSEVRFRYLFCKATRMNPVRFLHKRRVDQARLLLQTTSQSVKEIARAVGMDNLSFFHRIFRRRIQLTPLQYRQKMTMH